LCTVQKHTYSQKKTLNTKQQKNKSTKQNNRETLGMLGKGERQKSRASGIHKSHILANFTVFAYILLFQ